MKLASLFAVPMIVLEELLIVIGSEFMDCMYVPGPGLTMSFLNLGSSSSFNLYVFCLGILTA